MNAQIEKIINLILELSVSDLVSLIDKLSEKLGVDLSSLTASPIAATAAPATVAEEEAEDVSFKVDITAYNCDKPTAMKALRAMLSTSLIETKNIIDNLPFSLADKPYTKAEADEISSNLTAQGFTAVVKKV